MSEARDIILVLPPRPAWVLDSLRPDRAAPCQELSRVANDLGRYGFSAFVLNADLMDEDAFQGQLYTLHCNASIIAFLCSAYRFPAATRAAQTLKEAAGCYCPRLILFGHVTEEFESDPQAGFFDKILLGPDWSVTLARCLNGFNVSSGRPRAPEHVSLAKFEELTGDPGLSACIEAPARGCPHHCSFCVHQMFRGYGKQWGAYVKPRPVGEVVEEMSLAWDRGARSAVFLESNFLSYPTWAESFAARFRDVFPSLVFAAATRLTDIVKAEANGILDKLQAAGLVAINCGLESGVDAILKNIRKDATVDEYLQGDLIARKRGLRRFYNLVLGLPGETEETIQASWSLMRRLAPTGLQVAIATPLPGTPFYNRVKAEGLLMPSPFDAYYYYRSCVIDLPGLPAEKLLDYQKAIHEEFQNRPIPVGGLVKKGA